MTTTEAAAVPVQGQLVTARNRQWITSEVVRSEVASSDPHFFSAKPTHLVSLVSIEDDARDEELRVVWELEAGAASTSRRELPGPGHGFDDPAELDAFLDAVRWGAIASRRHERRCRRRSAPASRSRTTSSTRSCGRCRCRARTC